MSSPLTLWLTDRSRYLTGTGHCARLRYLKNHFGPTGYGIVHKADSLPLMTGRYLHEAFEPITKFLLNHDQFPPAEIVRAGIGQACNAYQQDVQKRGYKGGILENESSTRVVTEQICLITGLVWAACRTVLPWLFQHYRVLQVEQESIYVMGCTCGLTPTDPAQQHSERGCQGIGLMQRQDLIAEKRAGGGLAYFELKSTGWAADTWSQQWETKPQLGLGSLGLKERYGKDVTELYVIGLYKGSRKAYGEGAEAIVRQESPFCLTPTTRVLTSDLRWIPVGQLRVGDEIAAFDEYPTNRWGFRARAWQRAVVEAIGRDKQRCVRLVLSDGTTVTCSREHLWLTAWGGTSSASSTTVWTQASELRPQNIFGKTAHKIFKALTPWDIDNSFTAGYLSGLLDGEGYLAPIKPKTTKHRAPHIKLGFSQKPGLVMDRAKSLFDQLGVVSHGPYNPYSLRSSTALQISNRSDVISVLGRVRPQRLLEKFDLNGLGVFRSKLEPVTVVSVEDVGTAVVVPIKTSSATLIAEGYASHNCYGFCRPGNPPLATDDWKPEYRYTDPTTGEVKQVSRAHQKRGIWELPESDWPIFPPSISISTTTVSETPWTTAGVAEWWANYLPDETLKKQVFLVGPLNRQDAQLDATVRQIVGEEYRWQDRLWTLYQAQENGATWESPEFQALLDQHIPCSWECRRFGTKHECEMTEICFKKAGWTDPLGTGHFVPRRPHHQPELDVAISRGLLPAEASEAEETDYE